MKKVKVPLFPVQLRLAIVDKIPGTAAGLTEYFADNGTIIVTLTPNPEISTIVHETCHVVQYIQDFIETQFDQETAAYLTQYIFEKIWKYFQKQK